MSLFQPRLLVVGTAAAAVALPGQFVGRFTTPAELSESFNVVAPQPLKPLLMHHLLRQPDWRRSLVLVNWNEVAHQLELPLSVLGARAVKLMLERQRSNFQRLMVQAGGRVRETLALLDELRAAPVRGDLRDGGPESEPEPEPEEPGPERHAAAMVGQRARLQQLEQSVEHIKQTLSLGEPTDQERRDQERTSRLLQHQQLSLQRKQQ
ncbi:putative ATP-dependent RNA helicase Dbp73D [Amphibalanus amphitrite]|uniref:Putative ATP-dependent RNA helicase Dbp73D n=1 Tax=Amphibalanus amphitrite TaxID=1232801 RepID=A0A6A4W459_AMPAM|nr:putative ATP-dependent RNA helicase Dbp73D [Amphibalanus amphitrite]